MDGNTMHALQAKADLAAIRHTIHQRRFEWLTPESLCAGLRIPRARAEAILAELAGTCLQEGSCCCARWGLTVCSRPAQFSATATECRPCVFGCSVNGLGGNHWQPDAL